MANKPLPKWVRDDNSVVACTEKVRVMKENFDEIKQITQDAFEDGLLMEVSDEQMRKALHGLIDGLVNRHATLLYHRDPHTKLFSVLTLHKICFSLLRHIVY